jgi:hypothetical protein
MIRIVHTRDYGTLVFGASGEDIRAIVKNAGDRWQFSHRIGPEGAWFLPNSHEHRPRRPVIDRLAEHLRSAGREVEVTIALSGRSAAAIEVDRLMRPPGS